VERILKELEGRYPKEVSPDDLSIVASLAPPAGSCGPGGGEVEGTVEKVRELALGE